MSRFWFSFLLFVLSAKQVVFAQVKKLQASKQIQEAKLVKKIATPEFGGLILRFGDLNSDGQTDLLTVQNYKRSITRVTALDLNGKQLWQIGAYKPPPRGTQRSSADLPIQIFDLYGNNKNEIILVHENMLKILDGSSAKTLKETPVHDTIDAIFIWHFQGKQKAPAIVIKNRYSHFWVYSSDLILLWEAEGNTGHFPFAFDYNADGIEELLVGYRLYDSKGTVLWNLDQLPHHNDATDSADLDNNGTQEMVIATGDYAHLVDAKGKILWAKPMKHSQHAMVGSFIWEQSSKKQAVFVDRGEHGRVSCFDALGNLLWNTPGYGALTMANALDGWTGKINQNAYILLFRRDRLPPGLLDGKGQEVLRFPFPPAQSENAYNEHFVQHFDILGDGREEVIINNENEIWIYANPDQAPATIETKEKLPNPRIYNASFYSGMQ